MRKSVNSYLPEVNGYLRGCGYFARMTKKTRGKPGSKKGESKPLKDKLDPGFKDRLWEAMVYRSLTNHAELGRLAGCSRAVVGQYLSGEKRAPGGLTLLRIANSLRVSANWLILNKGNMLDGIQEEQRPSSPQSTPVAGSRRIRPPFTRPGQ